MLSIRAYRSRRSLPQLSNEMTQAWKASIGGETPAQRIQSRTQVCDQILNQICNYSEENEAAVETRELVEV